MPAIYGWKIASENITLKLPSLYYGGINKGKYKVT